MSQEEASRIARAAERVRRSRGGALKVAIPTAAVLGAGAAVAIGSIPSSNGTITACYNTIGGSPGGSTQPYGALRVIDPSQATVGGIPSSVYSCDPKSESTITWNQQGPAGIPGATGPTGPQGSPGTSGAPGAQGAAGSSFAAAFGIQGSGRSFFKIKGITGLSMDKRHQGFIDVQSFSLGATGGGGAGKVSFGSFTIVKQTDKTSPTLMRDAMNKLSLGSAEVTFAKVTRGQAMDYLKFQFSNVMISSFKLSSGGDRPTESITISFQKVDLAFLNAGKVLSVVKLSPSTFKLT